MSLSKNHQLDIKYKIIIFFLSLAVVVPAGLSLFLLLNKNNHTKPESQSQNNSTQPTFIDFPKVNARLTIPDDVEVLWYNFAESERSKEDVYDFGFAIKIKNQPAPEFTKSKDTIMQVKVHKQNYCDKKEGLGHGSGVFRNKGYCITIYPGTPDTNYLKKEEYQLYDKYTLIAENMFKNNLTKL